MRTFYSHRVCEPWQLTKAQNLNLRGRQSFVVWVDLHGEQSIRAAYCKTLMSATCNTHLMVVPEEDTTTDPPSINDWEDPYVHASSSSVAAC